MPGCNKTKFVSQKNEKMLTVIIKDGNAEEGKYENE